MRRIASLEGAVLAAVAVVLVVPLSLLPGIGVLAQDAGPTAVSVVSGQVHGPEGALSGARIVVVSVNPPERKPPEGLDLVEEARCGLDGSFEVRMPGEAPFVVFVAAPGFAPEVVTCRDVGEALSVTLGPGIPVEGVVSDEASASTLEGATVRAWPQDAELFRLRGAGDLVSFHATSGADGRYLLPHLSPGIWIFEAGAPNRVRVRSELSLSFQDPRPVPQHFSLARGTSLSGRVLDSSGDPLAGARVMVSADSSSRGIKSLMRWLAWMKKGETSVQTSEEGTFSFDGLPLIESYTLAVSHENYPSSLVRGLAPGSDGVEIRLSAGVTVRFSIVDSKGSALTEPLTAGFPSSPGRGGSTGESYSEENVEPAEGIYTLHGVPAGQHTLRLFPESHLPIDAEIDAREGESLDLGALHLPAGVTLAGSVVDDRGAPVPGAHVAISYGPAASLVVEAGKEGRFSVSGFSEGETLEARAEADGYAPSEGVSGGPGQPLRLVLTRLGGVRGRVVRADLREPAHSFTVTVTLEAAPEEGRGTRFTAMMMGKAGKKRVFSAAADGAFEFGSLAPGRYSVQVEASGCIPARAESVEVAAGQSAEIGELSLVPGATVEGRVFDRETGVPIPGASVRRMQPGIDLSAMRAMEGEEAADAISGADGEFRIGGLPPGSFRFSVEREGYAKSEFEAVISAGVPPEPVHVELGTGGAIEGIARGPDGAPMAGAVVTAMRGMTPDLKKIVNTDEEGHFRIDRLAPGTYMVVWMKPPDPEQMKGGGGGMLLPQMRSVVVEEGKTVTLGRRGSERSALAVQGRFLRGSQPLASIQSLWRPPRGAALPISVLSDEAGVFRSTLPGPGNYQVTLLVPGDESSPLKFHSMTLDVKVTGDRATQLDIVLPESRVSGTVTEEKTGAPVNRARVRALLRNETGELVSLHAAASDEEGRFEIDSLAAGEYYFVVTAPRLAAQLLGPTKLGEEEEVDDLAASLSPARSREVRIRGEGGEPLPGMSVIPLGEGKLAWAWLELSDQSDANGAIRLDTLPDGVWDLAIVGSGAALTIVEDVAIGPDATGPVIVAVGRGGVLSLLVTGQGQTPVAGAEVRIEEKGGRDLTRLLQGYVSSRKGFGLSTDETGRLVIDGLAPGEYRYSVTATDGRTTRGSARIRAGEEVHEAVSLP